MVRAAAWVQDHWPRLLNNLGIVGMAACGLWVSITGTQTSWYQWGLFWVCAVIAIVAEIINWKSLPRLATLQSDNQTLRDTVNALETSLGETQRDYFDLFQDELSILANDVFQFTDNERISVYKHDGKAFVMLGRYSKDPEYIKRGRSVYPDNEGCIATAWRDGEAFVNGLPDPSSDLNGYVDALKDQWDVNKTTARNFKMKSRSYGAYAVEDLSGIRRIAVVVIESCCVDVLDDDRLKELLSSYEGRRIAHFLGRMQRFEPSLTFARQEGY